MLNQIISDAANIQTEANPSYDETNFSAVYPGFREHIPPDVMQMYIKVAHGMLSYSRWLDMWEIGMGLAVAHFCTLWLQTKTDEAASAETVAAAGKAKGLIIAKGASGLSVSYDFLTGTTGISQWAGFLETEYGKQLVTLSKLIPKGGMVIW